MLQGNSGPLSTLLHRERPLFWSHCRKRGTAKYIPRLCSCNQLASHCSALLHCLPPCCLVCTSFVPLVSPAAKLSIPSITSFALGRPEFPSFSHPFHHLLSSFSSPLRYLSHCSAASSYCRITLTSTGEVDFKCLAVSHSLAPPIGRVPTRLTFCVFEPSSSSL